MIGRSARVLLHDAAIGTLGEDAEGYIELRLDTDYLRRPNRAVLGQWFEDHPRGVQRGERAGELPTFFANLIPEGDLALVLRERLDVHPGDDFGLLLAVGDDLPGAVRVVATDREGAPVAVATALDRSEPDARLRFSLAGVQLKFSMIRRGDRFHFPGRDHRGDWIAKIALAPFEGVCENEYCTMEWARRCGFDVPACELHELSDLVDVPHDADPTTPVFAIRRYDRDGDRRIHQEDFQQMVGRRPDKKYSDVTYETLVLIAMKVVGDDVYQEMLKRLVFVVASGNDDAHLKNWSVLYPDTIHARPTPLYDQVFTAQWPTFSVELALKLAGTKSFAAIEMGRFRELARRVGADEAQTARLVEKTIDEIATAWPLVRDLDAMTQTYRDRIHAHWQRVPVLAPHAGRIL
jgi:serine/threonine-protein kinase HipA